MGRGGSDTARQGDEFERKVQAAFGSLGYAVTRNSRDGGRQSDLIARRVVGGAPPITLLIECKGWSQAVHPEEVEKLVRRVDVSRSASSFTQGVMVAANGFTLAAREVAKGHPDVLLLSWAELEAQVLDVRHPLAELVRAYEESEIHQDYQPLEFERLSWKTFSADLEPSSTHAEVLKKWRDSSGERSTEPSTLVALADFGGGKTTLLKHLEYELGKAHVAGHEARVPLYVPLRRYRDSRDVTAALRTCFRDTYWTDLSSDLLWTRLQGGHFFLLLDGFDEMADKSDARRRLELFYELLGVLRTPSPTIITARPGYFVGREELNDVLASLREQELAMGKGAKRKGSGPITDELRRELMRRNRRLRFDRRAFNRMGNSDLRVVSLCPLDDTQIKRFIEGRRGELAQVGVKPQDVLDFIEETHDLPDLSTRPLLLKMIIDSVVSDALDLGDSNAPLGASNLYEAYTGSKLSLDAEDGRAIQEGLSVELRTELTEAAAVAMYEENKLEADFDQLVETLRSGETRIAQELAEAGLSAEEIATDLATCSFLTLEQGVCRFIHKSFRAFFVARTIKRQFNRDLDLMEDLLDREILYFLGGFAPGEQGVAESLWTAFVNTGPAHPVMRRNLLVAYLFTKPEHQGREIVEADISEAAFKKLSFSGTLMDRAAWRRCELDALLLDSVEWREVSFARCQIGELAASASDLGLAFEESNLESVELRGGSIRMGLAGGSTVDKCRVRDLGGEIALEDAEIVRLEASNSALACAIERTARIASVTAADSFLQLRGSGVKDLDATRSVIRYEGDQERARGWKLSGSLLCLDADAALPGYRARGEAYRPAGEEDGERTVVLCPQGVSPQILARASFGFFGALAGDGELNALPQDTPAWGVLHGDALLEQQEIPTHLPGCRYGELLIVRTRWYEREEISQGISSSLAELRSIAAVAATAGGAPVLDRLGSVLVAVKAQFDALSDGYWPEFREPDASEVKTQTR